MMNWVANHHLKVQSDSDLIEDLSEMTGERLRRHANTLVNVLNESDLPDGADEIVAKSIQYVLLEEQRRFLGEVGQ
jgi:hypothetical protein